MADRGALAGNKARCAEEAHRTVWSLLPATRENVGGEWQSKIPPSALMIESSALLDV
jgi:hypothetical protein